MSEKANGVSRMRQNDFIVPAELILRAAPEDRSQDIGKLRIKPSSHEVLRQLATEWRLPLNVVASRILDQALLSGKIALLTHPVCSLRNIQRTERMIGTIKMRLYNASLHDLARYTKAKTAGKLEWANWVLNHELPASAIANYIFLHLVGQGALAGAFLRKLPKKTRDHCRNVWSKLKRPDDKDDKDENENKKLRLRNDDSLTPQSA